MRCRGVCVWGFCWNFYAMPGASGYLLGLGFIFKMLCGSSLGGEGSPSSRLLVTTLCGVASSRPKAGFKVGPRQDGPSSLAFDQNAAAWQSCTSLPLLVLAGMELHFFIVKAKLPTFSCG